MVENEPDNMQVVLQKWQRTRRIQRKNINKLFDRAESYVNLNPRTTTESIEIKARCVLESLRDLEITNIECDREIQKLTTDETELDLTNIEKFTYLRSLLNKTASQAIEGFPLTADNYAAAWRLLNERFGNEQIIISSHMNKILNINPVYSPNVRSLRELYDNVESNMRALENLGVSYEQFGSLLIRIILEKLPNMIKLQISRKLESDNWNIQDFLDCVN